MASSCSILQSKIESCVIVQTFESVDDIMLQVLHSNVEQYFPVVLFIMLYKVVLTFESVDEILKCNYSNESY